MYELKAAADVLVMTRQGKSAIDRTQIQIASEPPLGLNPRESFAVAPSIEPAHSSESAEAILVEAVLAGNRDMFGRLYQLYAPLVHGILLARLPRGEVEDLVQDIFLHALRKLHTMRAVS
jgi:hypothetical protein